MGCSMGEQASVPPGQFLKCIGIELITKRIDDLIIGSD